MEFEELQKIWDTQNNQPLYVINEKALHNRIVAKKHQVIHIAGFTEWLLIIVHTGVGVFLFNAIRNGYLFVYKLAAWLFGSAIYVLINRLRRIKDQHRFHRTLAGDLEHALATAGYQVRIAQIMRWNFLPIGMLMFLTIWEIGKSIWLALFVAFVFILSFFVSRWELSIYKKKRLELEMLKKKLEEDVGH